MACEYDIMLGAKIEKIAALEAELELTREALQILAKEVDRLSLSCGYCAYYKGLGIVCSPPNNKDCADGYAAWAMEKAKGEQR